MQTAKSAQHMVPTMLGMIQNEAWKRGIPEGATPDTDLSEHSAKLVGGLKDRGIVPKTASTEVTNYVTHMSEPDPNYSYREEHGINDWAVPHEELKAGHQTVRNMLRAARGPRPHLSEQLSLFNK
jgi:hypothetical protein